jgi:2-dehydropantoate 2-reductase
MKPLRVLSIGAGAIGTYIGGSLAIAGNDVVFLEKLETAESIKALSLTLFDQTYTVAQPIVATDLENALSMGPFDIALFALKSFDTAGATQSLQPFADRLPPLLCLQNGVENEAIIAETLGEDHVIPATVTSAIGKTKPGQIVLEKFRGIGISSHHTLSNRLQKAFNLANLNAILFDHPEAMKWSKMLTNLVSNATSAILSLPPGEIFSHPKLFQIEIAQLQEALDVMKVSGIPIVDLPGTPVGLLAFTVKTIPQVLSRPLLKKAVVGGRGDKMPSFYLNLLSGKPNSEVEFLNGAVVRWGKKLNIPTPTNSFLTQTLLNMVLGEIPKEKYHNNTDKFIQDFSKFTD